MNCVQSVISGTGLNYDNGTVGSFTIEGNILFAGFNIGFVAG